MLRALSVTAVSIALLVLATAGVAQAAPFVYVTNGVGDSVSMFSGGT